MSLNIFDLIKLGGLLMVPIIFCSILVLTIVLERIFYFNSVRCDVQLLKDRVFDLIRQNKIKEAYVLCETNNSPTAKIMMAGLSKLGFSRQEAKESMESESLLVVSQLETNLTILPAMAQISTLLGLLGTVAGLVISFRGIEMKINALSLLTMGDLAGGIWQALITTGAGLLVAIGAVVAYNYCVQRVRFFVLEMQRAASELMDLMSSIMGKGQNREYAE
ncbi:MAG: MotA/TolQ/ExbB proton channel family protein [Candidatus Omnitrophica bacterium]|nr:MotA/TolQ/ExbB proton channel family protein [Candidatus Omnitrophota bacterium]